MKEKNGSLETKDEAVKTTCINADLGNYDSSRCIYILPPNVTGEDATGGATGMNGSTDHHYPLDGFSSRGQRMINLATPNSYDPEDRENIDRFFITQVNVPSDRRNGCDRDSFSCRLMADSFSETVSVAVLPRSGPRQSCAAFCNYESEQRFKETVFLEPSIAPSAFEVSMVCYQDCTKKKFRTTVNCCPRMRPRRYGTTSFVQPKRKESRFVAYVDYNDDRARQWHTSAVNILPLTACNSFVRGFQFADRAGSTGGEDAGSCIDELESIGSSGFLDDDSGYAPGQSDLDVHLNHSDALPNGGGYRAHMVVGGRK